MARGGGIRMHVRAVAQPADARGTAIASLFSPLAGRPYAFWLDSAAVPGAYSRRSLMGANPFAVFRWRGDHGVVSERGGQVRSLTGDPLGCLQGFVGELPRMSAAGPWWAVGFFSYDLGRHLERVPTLAVDDLSLPDISLAFYDALLEVDAASGTVHSLGLGIPEHTPRDLMPAVGCDEWNRGAAGACAPALDQPRWSLDRDAFCRAVERALDYIRAGEIYQVNLSRRLDAPFAGDPFDVYRRLRRLVPEPYGAYLSFPEGVIASASPELFLHCQGDRVVTRPIKGTRSRAKDPVRDTALARELLASPKDRAELLMIVDLERNDLGRVCRPGSVTVPETWSVESHPMVHHLVGTVEGRLRPGLGPLDLLRAAFPGGSITGAPKVRAMEIIEELEPVRRGVYTGALGFLSSEGEMELSIIIRTLLLSRGRAYLQVGSGIVADSMPEDEYRETRAKAEGLLQALGLS